MSALGDFQTNHGREWAELIGRPALAAALSLASQEKLEKIRILTDDQIATYGKVILADLRGHLLYENGLLTFHEKKEFVFQDLGPEQYPDPAAEAREEELAHQQKESGATGGPSPLVTTTHEDIFPSQKKTRGRPQTGKKKK